MRLFDVKIQQDEKGSLSWLRFAVSFSDISSVVISSPQ
jgi:hypothetical protein